MVHSLQSVEDASERLRATGYLPSPEIASSVFLADRLEKPILVEGPAGVGKTELAQALAQATGRALIRLQCYEGLDEAKALYEWEYAKQLLYTQLLKDKIGEMIAGTRHAGRGGRAHRRVATTSSSRERFLLPRPLLARHPQRRARRCCSSTRSTRPTRSSRRSCSRCSPTSRSPCPELGTLQGEAHARAWC